MKLKRNTLRYSRHTQTKHKFTFRSGSYPKFRNSQSRKMHRCFATMFFIGFTVIQNAKILTFGDPVSHSINIDYKNIYDHRDMLYLSTKTYFK